MRSLKYILVLVCGVWTSSVTAQSFDENWLQDHPKEAVDSIGVMARYHNYYRDKQPYYKAVVDTMLDQIVSSDQDSIWKSLAYKNAYKVISKRNLKPYFKRVRAIASYAPKDSVHLKFFSKYMIGNAYIFSEKYDSAAFYLSEALDYDDAHDLGSYEGAVPERLSMIFYRLGDYKRSLEFATLTLKDAQVNLRGAVYNQMANSYALTYQYEEAATAYDSAAYYYKLANNQGWWMPIYNSMTTHLELRDSARFMEAYNKIKDVPYVKQSGEFHHLMNMSKAEFSLTEWQRSTSVQKNVFGGMVLSKTHENETWIRDVIQEQIAYTEGEWRDHRDALYLLKRWYDLCAPDSVVYAYERILALDKDYTNSDQFNPRSSYLESGNIVELQNLVSRLSYSMLKQRLKEVSEVKQLLIRHSQNIFVFALLLIISLVGLWRIRRLRREVLMANESLKNLKDREERFLLRLLPSHQFEAWKSSGKTSLETYDDVIVLRADLSGFSSLIGTMNPDELLDILEGYFNRFKKACDAHDLRFVRTDGSSFIVVGGTEGSSVTPRQALVAAMEMFQSTEELNKMLSAEITALVLRVGIHLGQVDVGVPQDRVVGYDFWGDGFEECRALELACEPGEILMSKKAFESEVPGQQWPSFTMKTIGLKEVLVFRP